MESFVNFKITGSGGMKAEKVSKLFSVISEDPSRVAANLKLKSSQGSDNYFEADLFHLCNKHQESLACLERNKITENILDVSYVCGLDAPDFAISLSWLIQSLGYSIDEMTVSQDESVFVCRIVDDHVCAEWFYELDDYRESGFDKPKTYFRDHEPKDDHKLVVHARNQGPSCPTYLKGKWSLDVEATLLLFEEKINKEWNNMPSLMQKMFSPLDKYIDSMRDQYAKAGSKTIQFKDFEMLTHYGERNHGAIFFSIEAIGQTTKIIEYFEDLGDIEEEERSLTFSSDYDSFVMRWTKRLSGLF